MKIVDIINEADGDRYFNLNTPEAQETRNPRSRAALVYMSPEDFISLIPPGHVPEKLENTRRLAAKGVPFRDIPTLSFTHDGRGNAHVYGHEGRHRSMALHELGIQKIPVIMRSLGSRNGPEIRWGSQNNQYDKVPVMPRILHGSETNYSIPFPDNVYFPMHKGFTS